MGAPFIEHAVSEDGKLHTITARAFGAHNWYRATIPACDCGLKPCTTVHASSWARRQCGGGKCHSGHPEHVEALKAALRRTYGRGLRAHTPSYPARGGFRPTGKPEAIAAWLLALGPEHLTPIEIEALLPEETERVRDELAKADAS